MNFIPKRKLLTICFFLSVLVTVACLPAFGVQEEESPPSTSQEDVERFEEIQNQGREARIDAAVQENQTGADPRDFSLKWMPYYRSTDLENGLKQQDLTAFGTVPFSRRLGMFFEVPLAQYRDFSDVPGFPLASSSARESVSVSPVSSIPT